MARIFLCHITFLVSWGTEAPKDHSKHKRGPPSGDSLCSLAHARRPNQRLLSVCLSVCLSACVCVSLCVSAALPTGLVNE